MSPVLSWGLAATPIALLLLLVVRGRLSSLGAALASLALAVVVAAVPFGADPFLLAVATGKGLWLGFWIIFVVAPALLLYRVAAAGGMDRVGELFSSILPRRRQALLIVAWLFPTFVQGVAGFGTPIAVAAPLLVALGWPPVRAVVLVLVGYQWSVTFGSMGSSFYMASLSAGLGADEQAAFALTAAGMLALNALVAGALVLLLDGGPAALRQEWRALLVIGVPTGAALVGTAVVVPAVATLGATTVGFAAVLVLSRWYRLRGWQPESPLNGSLAERFLPVAPYLFLLLTALPVFLVPASRAWISSHAVVAPSFPSTRTSDGWVNQAVADFTPLQLLGHPGTFVFVAALFGFVVLRLRDREQRGTFAPMVWSWIRAIPKASGSIMTLAVLAMVLVDAGMVSVLARGASRVAGDAYTLVAPMIGALGAFTTGSTTASNALFAALQVEAARLLNLPSVVMLAAQTVGGNIGNAVAPVVMLVGLGALEREEDVGAVIRGVAPGAAVLMVCTMVVSTALAFVGSG